MFAHGLFTMAIEVSVARGDAFVLAFVRDSKWWRTLAFMFVNAALLRALRQSTGPNLWFLQPVREERRTDDGDDSNNNEELTKGATALSACCGKATTNCGEHIVQVMTRNHNYGFRRIY